MIASWKVDLFIGDIGMVSIPGLRWCPDCGQVELDVIHASATVVRAGDGRCRAHTEEWPRGTAQECNEFFGDRYPPVPEDDRM